MPAYAYVARDGSGRQQTGNIDADNERAAAAQLRSNGLFPINISGGRSTTAPVRSTQTAVGSEKKSGSFLDNFAKVGTSEIAVMCRQLAVMIRSGLPILKSLVILAEQTRNKPLKEALFQVYTDVQGGASLAVAFSRHPKAFPRMLVFMIQAAETGGALDVIIERLAVHYEKEKELKAKVSQAMMYPIVVSVVAVGVVNILIYFVLPQFATLFSGIPLPPQTRFLLWLPGAMRQYGLMYILVHVGLIFGLISWFKTEDGAYRRDAFLLKLPLAGDIIRKIATARFCRTLATLVGSGISVLNALDLVQNVVTNKVLTRGLARAQDSIRQGAGLSGPIEQARIFHSMVTQMIRVGEETGGLEEVLTKVSDFYESEVDGGLKTLVGLIEPAVLIVMGVIAGMIVSSIMIPMFDMMGAM